MNVKVEVELYKPRSKVDIDEMYEVARQLTNNARSVEVYIPDKPPNSLVAEFTINKARQMAVVDGIARAFRTWMRNYGLSAISFPDPPARYAPQNESYTRKQGQYLAFIYYYTKLSGYPPAEADMQRYFKTTPPSVHSMVLKLEKEELITKTPNQPRSIRLLLPREELPDLE